MAYCKCENLEEFQRIVRNLHKNYYISQLLEMITEGTIKELQFKKDNEELKIIKNTIVYSNEYIRIECENIEKDDDKKLKRKKEGD